MAQTPTPPQPPRPGDPVPAGGLDPTQVFGSPPPPPQAQGQQTGGAQQDGTIPPTDQGPPPPPPGTKATKEMGFDDEDLKILAEVGDYRFGSITTKLTNENIPVPAHPETKFDDQKFLMFLSGSISLTRDEKWRIIMAIPKLSQFQIDELQKILEEERRKFSELSPKHLLQLMKLEQKHSEDWHDLQAVSVQQAARGQEEEQADDIRKQLGLS
ncbi:MAG: hypothetical protein ABIG34_02055 [Candidatus Peregrinibacteria bacterium]